MDKMILVENGKSKIKLVAIQGSKKIIENAMTEVIEDVKAISGAIIQKEFITLERIPAYSNCIILGTFSDIPFLKEVFIDDYNHLQGTDGFAVREYQGNVYIFAAAWEGVYFGVFGFLEKATPIIWSRGFGAGKRSFVPTKTIIAKEINYCEIPYFATRGWNNCGVGVGGSHLDRGTMVCFSKNKINAKLGTYDDEYKDLGIKPVGRVIKGFFSIDKEMKEHPNYFMIDFDGKLKTCRRGIGESFINYYDEGVAEYFANKIMEVVEQSPENETREFYLGIPDDSYFHMVQDGKVLSALPFTTDDGYTVYPEEDNYKSTVYYNYLNRIIRFVEQKYPKVRFFTLAYLYCEACPKTNVSDKLGVAICPITSDEHVAYADDNTAATQRMLKNLKEWREKTPHVYMYNYWQCFKGNIYSRPAVKVVQKNLWLYREMGIKHLIPEGKLDGAEGLGRDKFFDMNEMYYWQMNRLFWNMDENVDEMTKHFCDVVYGNASLDMQAYYALIQKGWDESAGYVFNPTGGDLYIKKFIIEAGVAEGVLNALKQALQRDITKVQEEKIRHIYEIVNEQITLYSKIVNEDAYIAYTDLPKEKILSDEMLAVHNNPKSVWNKPIALKVFKDYNTLEDYDEKAGLNIRMLCDDEYMYIGFMVYDDLLDSKEVSFEGGFPLIKREDGSRVLSYTETYIGGTLLDMSLYYGFISGFISQQSMFGVFTNEGVPKRITPPEDFEEKFYVHWEEKKEKRYYFHVQAISFKALGVKKEDAKPYGSFVYYSDRYGRVGWKGNGLWNKAGFSPFVFEEKNKKN